MISKLDILYATPIQTERVTDQVAEWVKNDFIITPALLTQAKANLKILHPLPRVNDIDAQCDALPYAYYFQQASNALPVCQALLSLLLLDHFPYANDYAST